MIKCINDEEENDIFLVQDGASYKIERAFFAIQFSTVFEDVNELMLAYVEHEGEHDDEKIRYNKYFTMVAKFKGETIKFKLKVMTLKKDKQKII